jgi:adenine-specific DNA-methyltransferase
MKRNSKRNHGEVFTGLAVVDYLLDGIVYRPELDLSRFRILEPAAGHGSFATAILRRLYASSVRFGFSFIGAVSDNIAFIEQDADGFEQLCAGVAAELLQLSGEVLPDITVICKHADFLTVPLAPSFDGVVGNPPYIRHERISEPDKRFYRERFSTFKYRADLYIPFFERGLSLLKPEGILAYICANRWLTNQYGRGLRELIASSFHLKKLLNMERASPFDEEVMAYPCIAVIENTPFGEWTLYADNREKEIDFNRQVFQVVRPPAGADWDAFFLGEQGERAALLPIESQGFKIGIGVATGSDEVFILPGSQRHCIEQSRLLPLVSSADLRNNRFNWTGRYLVNPYDADGLCRLADFPRCEAYLLGHREKLQKRHTAQKTPDKWYKTIDRVYPDIKNALKILLPDLAAGKFLFIDEGNYYPHHNLYHITGDRLDDLKVLAALLMSAYFREQIGKLGVRMNGGFPRLQSQMLRKLRMPVIAELDEAQKGAFTAAYDQRDLGRINDLTLELVRAVKDFAA